MKKARLTEEQNAGVSMPSQLVGTGRSNRAIHRSYVAVLVASIALGGCVKHAGDTSSGHIVIEKESVIAGVRGQPNALVRTSDGNLVVVGASDSAWAMGLSSDGTLRWQYKEARDPNVSVLEQSVFRGIVPLGNGSSLLCGDVDLGNHIAGLIVLLDRDGHVVKRRLIVPKGDPQYTVSGFWECQALGSDFVFTGVATNATRGAVWLMTVDKDGETLSEIINPSLVSSIAMPSPTGDLILMGSHDIMRGLTLQRVSVHGEILRQIVTDYAEARPVRPLLDQNQIQVVASTARGDNIVLTLDEDLREKKASSPVGPPSISDGCAYELQDGSIVLFGSHLGPVYRAAIGWVHRPWGLPVLTEVPVPRPNDSSIGIRDALPLGGNRFVAVRDQASTDPAKNGIVISWITLN